MFSYTHTLRNDDHSEAKLTYTPFHLFCVCVVRTPKISSLRKVQVNNMVLMIVIMLHIRSLELVHLNCKFVLFDLYLPIFPILSPCNHHSTFSCLVYEGGIHMLCVATRTLVAEVT